MNAPSALGAVALVCSALAACAPAAPAEDGAAATDALTVESGNDSFVMVHRTAAGYALAAPSRPSAPVTVVALEFRDAEVAAIALAAGDGELVVRGHLSSPPGRSFVVKDAFRGLPGMAASAEDVVYAITLGDCLADGCLPPIARPIDASGAQTIDRIDVAAAAAPNVDAAWLEERARAHGALVAGAIVDGTLVARQIFLTLPDLAGPCERTEPATCADGTLPTFERTADRCLVSTGCAAEGVCVARLPTCAPGYTLRKWESGSPACPSYACDPTFADRASYR